MTEKDRNTTPSGVDEHRKAGKALGKNAPRRSHGDWAPAGERPDPIAVLQGQDEGRIERLLPIKYGRTVASPYAFLRGSAAVMAADLAATPPTGLDVVLCGDAHLTVGTQGTHRRHGLQFLLFKSD